MGKVMREMTHYKEFIFIKRCLEQGFKEMMSYASHYIHTHLMHCPRPIKPYYRIHVYDGSGGSDEDYTHLLNYPMSTVGRERLQLVIRSGKSFEMGQLVFVEIEGIGEKEHILYTILLHDIEVARHLYHSV